jgi:hypothetical protein
MSKVFYHWGLEERVRKLCHKSNMVLFNRCESFFFFKFHLTYGLGVQTSEREPSLHGLFWFLLPVIFRLLIDHSHHPRALTTPTVESGEDLGGHVWTDELLRETGGDFLFARVSARTTTCSRPSDIPFNVACRY